MTTDIDNIVNTSSDPVESFVISACTIARKLESIQIRGKYYVVTGIRFQVDIHESIMSAPDSACHTWPGLFNTQDALDIIAV